MRTYTQDQIIDANYKHKMNHEHIADLLVADWKGLKPKVALGLSIELGGYDESSAYLSDMEGQEIDINSPEEYWLEYCKHNCIEHEEENNPFI